MLGHGEKWQGGDYMAPGGGQRIRLLKEALEEMKEEQEKTILFIDRYSMSPLSPGAAGWIILWLFSRRETF